LNECKLQTGMLANVPAIATKRSSPTWMAIPPSRM
jgi:hypothetical protein